MIALLEKLAILWVKVLFETAIISWYYFVLIGLTELVQILRMYYDHPSQLSFMNVYAKRSRVPGAIIIDGMISSSSQQIL